MKYTVAIENTGNGHSAYCSTCRCVAAADTREEAEQVIREAIGYHLEMFRESGEPTSEPETTTSLVEV